MRCIELGKRLDLHKIDLESASQGRMSTRPGAERVVRHANRGAMPSCPFNVSSTDVIAGLTDKQSRLVRRSFDTELLHPRPERAGIKVQKLRRALFSSDAPVGCFEDLKDVGAFYVFQRRRACCG